jgi:hypothetical protein
MKFTTALGVLSAAGAATALSPAEWRKQSIYQLLTDRFARTDGSTTASCDTQNGVYCGGSWQGVIDKLDYIQGMGFTAVRSPPPPAMVLADRNRSGSPLSSRTSPGTALMASRTMATGPRTSMRSIPTSAARLTWWRCRRLSMQRACI